MHVRSGQRRCQTVALASLHDLLPPFAPQKYANFGSDTGGYRSGARTAEVLLRWAQVNAFLPLFENGGDGEHRPWAFDAPGSTLYVDAYRRLVAAHYEIGPLLLSVGTNALLNGTSAIQPTVAPPADFPFILQPDELSDYSFTLGGVIFVAPVTASNVTSLTVRLPPGTAASPSWYEFWNPSVTHAGNTSVTLPLPVTDSAVFVRTGALLPLHVSTPQGAVPYGSAALASALTALVHGPVLGGADTVDVPGWHEAGARLSYSYEQGPNAAGAGASFVFEATPLLRDVALIVRALPLRADAAAAVAAAAAAGLQPPSWALNVTVHSAACGGAAADAVSPQWLDAAPLLAAAGAARTAAAVSWDAAAAAPLRPIAGVGESLRAAAAPLACGWSLLPTSGAFDATSDGAVGQWDVLIHAGSGADGARVVITHPL